MYKIGQVAKRVNMPVKTIRYYADIGLIEPSSRSDGNYRLYDDRDIRKLGFVRRSRAFGFSVEQCKELLSLYEDDSRAAENVREIANERLREIKILMGDLKAMHDELDHLVHSCKGGERPNCPILDAFSGGRQI
jgi:Cu(I)-responsive transcriptional regulator